MTPLQKPALSKTVAAVFLVRSYAHPCFLTALAPPLAHADNKVLGEIDLVGASKVENTSGVWVSMDNMWATSAN